MATNGLKPHRRRLVALVLGIAFTWCAAVLVVIDKFRRFGSPVPLVSAIFFGVFASAFTMYQVQIYLAGERQRSGE